MKKLLLLLVFVSAICFSQTGNTVTVTFPGAPSGTCAPIMVALNLATGAYYDCLSGSWNLVGGGGGSSFSWTNGAAGRICYYADATHCDGDSDFTWASATNQLFAGGSPPTLSDSYYPAVFSSVHNSTLIAVTALSDGYGEAELNLGFKAIMGDVDRFGNPATVGQFVELGFMFAERSNTTTTATTVVGLGTPDSTGSSNNSLLFNRSHDVCLGDTSYSGSAVLAGSFCINGSTGRAIGTLFGTATNCADSAGAAACGSAAAGAFVVDAAGTSTVVSTTAVTANSEILVFFDASLSTRLGITCNSTVPALYGVTARTAGTSFTLTASAPVTNPACFNFLVIN